ncbi:hypothetical protein KDK_17030 [Dictyobacter kobayashii]|uniref:Uncharacterized protein n=1 Tax=Dictyobacter kobayashii TaxID=2014872 RepID=A0A402AFR6_9CHLR|nr:hypothetical protein KDK_17030 [Dictyobacter kobayashii]
MLAQYSESGDAQVFDKENPIEIARLTEQIWLFIKAMGGH